MLKINCIFLFFVGTEHFKMSNFAINFIILLLSVITKHKIKSLHEKL
jgi:hypothetical protein